MSYKEFMNRETTAHVDHPDHKSGDQFLGFKDLETIFVPEQTCYRKETVGKYQFDYFFICCYRDGIESWLSLDQLRKIFGLASVIETAEIISGRTFTVRTTKRIVSHNDMTCELSYFSIIEIK